MTHHGCMYSRTNTDTVWSIAYSLCSQKSENCGPPLNKAKTFILTAHWFLCNKEVIKFLMKFKEKQTSQAFTQQVTYMHAATHTHAVCCTFMGFFFGTISWTTQPFLSSSSSWANFRLTLSTWHDTKSQKPCKSSGVVFLSALSSYRIN